MKMIDLRSDTVTQPDKAMRQAIATAEVGDDVFDEDPTVHRLQERICKITGKEAALFVTSGTQANQTALKAHTQSGDEVICDYRSHIFNYEGGAPAIISGVQLHPLQGEYGVLPLDIVEEIIRPDNDHFPNTRLIAVENTHNRWGGTVYPMENIRELRKIADRHSLKMHMDGARLWNAAVVTGIPVKEYASYFDSVSLCFSKGLGAPAGSVIAGSGEFIQKARYYRKIMGGGMRQAGILAAAALYALEHNIGRLAEDHLRARKIAEVINTLDGFLIDLQSVQSNIVIIDTTLHPLSAAAISDLLGEKGIRVLAIAENRLRIVTHLHISDEDVDKTIETFKAINHGKS